MGGGGWPYLPIKTPDEKINTQETVWAHEDGGVGGSEGASQGEVGKERKEI